MQCFKSYGGYFIFGVLQFANRQADEDETRPVFFSTIGNASNFCPPKTGVELQCGGVQ